MMVGVNLAGLKPGRGGGAEHYIRNVLATMRDVQPDTRFVLITDPDNHDSFDGWDRECLAGAGLFSGLESRVERAARQRNADVLFTPLESAPAKSSIPIVVFALDLYAWEEDAEESARKRAVRIKTVKRVCENAAAIVAPSGFVQRKYLELLGIPLNKVVVAPLGVSEVFAKPQTCFIQKPYFLVVGATRAYRNLKRLREVFDILKDDFPHGLVVVGQPAEAEPADWGPRVMRIESCPATHLAGLYQHCDVFIQPSLYEGSGVTVLEAMRSGAPVVTSRTGGIAEVAGDTPIYFNPESTHSIIAGIRWALDEQPEQRQARVRYGKQAASEYTWERCAWKTLSAFKRT
ncbi:MAG TPA: glycosyltransferase family 1 protein [Candidatus Hydrogenedentes bacterium]|nr:glycosyltransferase family 1 protein [Candidatus Hydrogenedentota bacterium]HOV74135.1 glycosyltransferase family 1 protein [Candidatus Hydrogenedentota bacterium]HPC15674.1 glycosyltransferase family 1 protein [Candidatus Hydrogenedentota bacterium]HRT19702.1 glycosyltransferase family 1 protein [Candidatus Hydrogenedentota bacterium]HRT64476.1 glycosyltransferase family 1 protein [Candidatus Hydrogenedentota bacterium]